MGPDLGIAYAEISGIVSRILVASRREAVQFMWYSPTPMCLFNPIPLGLGNKGCSACEGLLSISPAGEFLPCSSWPEPLGNLLQQGFHALWFGARARWIREKRESHGECRACKDFALCHGACPLYFKANGYGEIEPHLPVENDRAVCSEAMIGAARQGVEEMSDFLERLGFPAPEQQDSIRFYFAKGLTYRTRRILILACLLAGLILQIVMMRLWPGILCILLGVALGLVKGYDSRVRLKSFKNDETWTEVQIEKLREIESIRQKSKRWDRDALDITNNLGCAVLVIALVLGICLSFLAGAVVADTGVTGILLADVSAGAAVLRYRRAPGAEAGKPGCQGRALLKLHEHFTKRRMETETFVPMMRIGRAGEGKTVPVDVRFQVRYRGLPPDRFYGLQGTVNINLVQGTSYAYFYCVIVAKTDFGLKKYRDRVKQSNRVMCEYQVQDDAEVLVIRHPTTKTSGYHTNDAACAEILTAAMDTARIIENEHTLE